jgi:ATP/ADP translocase
MGRFYRVFSVLAVLSLLFVAAMPAFAQTTTTSVIADLESLMTDYGLTALVTVLVVAGVIIKWGPRLFRRITGA